VTGRLTSTIYWRQVALKKANRCSSSMIIQLFHCSEWQPMLTLCFVCGRPISPERHCYFECCDLFSCENCAENWEFPGHCPRCCKKIGLVLTSPEKIAEVSKANAGMVNIPIAKGLSFWSIYSSILQKDLFNGT
jgi:hypothetical protein